MFPSKVIPNYIEYGAFYVIHDYFLEFLLEIPDVLELLIRIYAYYYSGHLKSVSIVY